MLCEEVDRLSFKEESFCNDDKKIAFFTGLPSLALLTLILSQMNHALDTVKVKKLTNFQKLILTLMKLRNNLSFRGLAYWFDIRNDEASYCFKNVVVFSEFQFRSLIHWPDQECLKSVVPSSFREAFGNSVVVIIDCFEIHSEQASNAKAQAQCFFNFKHTQTSKYLIGITTNGSVSFISDRYAGWSSDKYISENSGFLDHLLRGGLSVSR